MVHSADMKSMMMKMAMTSKMTPNLCKAGDGIAGERVWLIICTVSFKNVGRISMAPSIANCVSTGDGIAGFTTGLRDETVVCTYPINSKEPSFLIYKSVFADI